KVEMLSRMLDVLQKIDHDFQIDADSRRTFRHKVRSFLSARDYASYRQAVSEMNEGVAGTFRRRVERTVGLAQAVREGMIRILRDAHPAVFVKEVAVEPWADEDTLWTTAPALGRREEVLRDIIEVKMPANEKAIGEAAAHGDLSENSEYQFACEERNFLRTRAGKLQEELSRAQVIMPEDVPESYVGIGSRVRLRRVDDGMEVELTFLGVWDTDLENRVYSYLSALASQFMGQGVGHPVELKIEGLQGQYTIEGFASALE
ncbi:hypothetical protein LCGC14_2608650, partial [marine sediment metagenome]